MAAVPDVLVTGSAGHLGCALMLSLASHGHTPIGIDILAAATTTHVGSIADRPFVASIFARYPSIQHVLHAATLHKPHVDSHTKTDFINVNMTGTLNLLEEASALGPQMASFPRRLDRRGRRADPKNIYGVTKVAAEDLCRLVHAQTRMPVLVLRTSRFFPEQDDDEDRRRAVDDENLKVLELAYRRVDISDVVSACVCAMARARDVGWGKYIISSPPPFRRHEETLRGLDADAGAVYRDAVPGMEDAFARRGWGFLPRIDRVYDSSRAVAELGWKPEYTIQKTVERLARGEEWRSELAFKVGKRGYHAVPTGVYTTAER
ncbi:hypothetical protein BJF96_g4045 [Verticillium dahliae]|uniref:NAD-dependent epimerase/dehydratase domain-containing protein n=1 Tax=Verticillium dahliae TaxID=27337 RepID=A0AA44WJR3_VERDA|nr:hypothetical protein BJF96_g4045 [Verticillium dahliae]